MKYPSLRRRAVRAASAIALLLLAAGCSTKSAEGSDAQAADACAGSARPVPDSLRAADYDQTCRVDADCIAFSEQPFTCGYGCGCPTASVSASAASAIQADYERAIAQCPPKSCFPQVGCGACGGSGLVACVANRCTLCAHDECDSARDGGGDAAVE